MPIVRSTTQSIYMDNHPLRPAPKLPRRWVTNGQACRSRWGTNNISFSRWP